MRRIVRSLAVLGAIALSACSGGGSVLNFDNSSKADRVILTVQAPSNIARVVPGGALPISAVSVKGSQNGFVNSNRYKWSAALTTGMQYPAFELGQTKPCANVTLTVGGVSSPLVQDWGIYIAIDPTNEANILFIPPPVIPVPPGLPVGSTVTPAFPYCVVVSATSLDSPGAVGSITVAVVNPQAPTQ
jgi:hypothetical protein